MTGKMNGKHPLEASNRGYKQFIIKASTREEAQDSLINGKPLEIIRPEDTDRIRELTADKTNIWIDELADLCRKGEFKMTRITKPVITRRKFFEKVLGCADGTIRDELLREFNDASKRTSVSACGTTEIIDLSMTESRLRKLSDHITQYRRI